MPARTPEAILESTLSNAEALLEASKLLGDPRQYHISYHLVALALEEVGKTELLAMGYFAEKLGNPSEFIKPYLDDHVKKLFWALWGPSFGRTPLTRAEVDTHRGLALKIHETRLSSLYSHPEQSLPPHENVTRDEVLNLIGLTEARLGLARAQRVTNLDASDLSSVTWFLSATDDPEKRKHIFGSKSITKLIELGGNVRQWIEWLKGVYEENEREMQELLQAELSRPRPEGDEAAKEKWRITIRIYSHSHTLRQKALNRWNETVNWIKLKATGKKVYSGGKKDELLCDITLPKGVPIAALWPTGWGVSRAVVASINIASRGFFWWSVPRDSARFYDEILDIESNSHVVAEPEKRLEIGWGNLVLREEDLSATAEVFVYLTQIRGQKFEEPFNRYVSGLTLLSKIDIHFRVELNCFEEFYEALVLALRMHSSWNGQGSVSTAAENELNRFLSTSEPLLPFIRKGEKLDAVKRGEGEITLSDVIGMKLCCDYYFHEISRRGLEERAHKEVPST